MGDKSIASWANYEGQSISNASYFILLYFSRKLK